MILKAVRLCLQFNDKQLQRSLPEKTIQGWIFFQASLQKLMNNMLSICNQHIEEINIQCSFQHASTSMNQNINFDFQMAYYKI